MMRFSFQRIRDCALVPAAAVSPREMRAGDDTYFVKMRCAGCSGERRERMRCGGRPWPH